MKNRRPNMSGIRRLAAFLPFVVAAILPHSTPARADGGTGGSGGPSSATSPGSPSSEDTLLKTYPNLQKFLFAERKSDLYFGFGISPMIIQSNRIGFSANLFQIHYISDPWDVELFSASFGTTFAQQDYAKTRFFLLRTAPKIRVFKNISIGPIGGLEFVNFNNLNSRLNYNNYFTPEEPFSTFGFIYGANLSETFSLGQNHLLKINEIFYWQTYPYVQTSDGWKYYFTDPANPNSDPDTNQIKPSTVFMLEISFLL